MNRALFALLILLATLLVDCSTSHEPAAPDLGDPLACANDPRSPCPMGCNCREHDRVWLLNPYIKP